MSLDSTACLIIIKYLDYDILQSQININHLKTKEKTDALIMKVD